MLDSITEKISHFIGHLHLTSEELRMREKYDEFRHEKAKMEELKDHEAKGKAPTEYKLEGYEPDLNWMPKAKAASHQGDPPQLPAPQDMAETLQPVAFVAQPQPMLAPGQLPMAPAPALELTLLPPGSVATATLQALALEDNDVLGDVGAAGFALPESYAPHLDALVEVAHGLSPIQVPGPQADGQWADIAEALKAQVAAAAAGTDGATTVTGDAASGILVNGVAVDGGAEEAMPTLDDLLPEFLKSQRAEEEEEDGTGGEAPEDGETPDDGAPDDEEAPDPLEGVPGRDDPSQPDIEGHQVVAGANTAVNQAQVTSAWIDAEVIAVKGDAVQLAIITQVNVLSDQDALDPTAPPQMPSDLINAARIERISSEAGTEAPTDPLLPSNWVVTRIEGDLISYNWIQQTTYLTDHDRAVYTTGASNSYVALGANELVNTALIAELGFQFDLILVGGSLYDISVLTQINVLLDDDLVAGDVDASGGGNLLFNSASIEATGVDSFGAISDEYMGAIDSMVDGAGSMPAFLAKDGALQGAEVLRVLYISGDLVKMNLLKQVNVVGDADQILIPPGAVGLGPDGTVEVITGSNALANLAAIRDLGVDSVVMAGGQIYTDALIHQAGFVDADAAPTGVQMPGLANEAVAFLADHMIDPGAGPTDADGHAGPVPMEGGSLDVMQTVLS